MDTFSLNKEDQIDGDVPRKAPYMPQTSLGGTVKFDPPRYAYAPSQPLPLARPLSPLYLAVRTVPRLSNISVSE